MSVSVSPPGASMMDHGISAQLEAWPFRPGESPFRVKGGTFLAHQSYVEANVPGGQGAQAHALRPASRAFFEDGFLRSSSYDIAPLIEAGLVCGRLTGTSFQEFVHARSAAQVETDVSGVYRFIAKLATPSGAALRMARGFALYFDFIEATVHRRGSARLEVELEGMPELLVYPWFQAVFPGYAEGLARFVRAPRVDARLERLERTGQIEGVDVVRTRLVIDYG
ncbi:MAG: hypothetical protein AAGH15_25030 [Myxococcota bacterium]